MSKVTKINFDLDQEYAPKDVVLINPIQLQRTFGTGNDYIETHIYDLNSNLLKSDYNFINYKSLTNSLPGPSGTLTELTVDPLIDTINNGYSYGTVDITYNIFRNSFGNTKDRLYIKDISTDRTELRITSNNISGDQLSGLFDAFSANVSSSSYYKDFYLNFGSNNILIGVNILLEGENLLIKLYEPLPATLSTKDQLWVIDKLSDPITYRVDFEIEAPSITDTSNHLKGPNFNIPITNQPNASIDYVSYSQILSNNSTSSYSQLKSLLEEKSLEINTDYSNYENFINFSSAKERLLNFVYKLKLVEDYKEDLTILETSLATPQISSSKAIIQNNIDSIIEKFDGYEYYLYYESGSKAWPKKSNTPPFYNYEITSSAGIDWLGTDDYNKPTYGGQLYSASIYDNLNQNNLINAIPEYLRIDPANQKYETFIYMMGQHFDNIWLYSKNITELYDADNSLDKGVSEDLVFEALKSLGIKLYTNTSTTDNIFSYLLGMTPSGSLSPATGSELITTYVTASTPTLPSSNIDKEVYKRLYHNLPYLLKTKGTERGLRALIACYGIPDTILRINEFGGTDKDSGSVEQYFNRVGYALNTKTGSLTGLTPWSPTVINEINFPGSNIVPDTVEFRFKTEGIPPSSSLYTQSLWQVETGSMTRFGAQLTFTSASNSGSYTDYGDLRLVISGNQGYTYSPPIHLPFFNNGWWNVMIQRETGSIPGANVTSSNRYWIYAANSIYSGHDGDDIGYIGSSSIFITGSTVSSSYHRSWNTVDTTSFSAYFGGGSSNNTIASGSTRFHGLINELRYWSVVLPKEDFINHTLNPLSYEYLNETSSYKYLSFRAPMGNDLIVSSSNFLYSVHPAYGKTGSFLFGGGANTSSYLEIRSPGLTLYGVGIYGDDVYYGYGSEIVYSDDTSVYYLNAGNLGYGKPTNNKIRIINGDFISGSTLSPFTNIAQKPEIPLTLDTNILEVSISPQDQINNDIIYQLGYFDIDDYIGDPREANLTEYGKLKELRAFYFQKYIAKYNIFDIVRLVKFYNNSLFKMIKDFVPARANISTGVTIKPHFLERPKVKRTEPSATIDNMMFSQSIEIGNLSAGQGGLFNGQTSSFIDIKPTILGPIGVVRNDNLEFFNGDLKGNVIIVTTQSLQNNPYVLNGTLDAGLFAHSKYNVLLNNISSSRLSTNKFKIDFNRSQNVASNITLIMSESAINLAEIQDSNYTLARHIKPRYEGCKNTSALYNIYTEGDISYGKTAAIDSQVRKLGLFTNVTESKFLIARQESRLKYLVDENGDLTELNLLNNNWFEVQNTFKSSNNSTIALFDVNKFGDQRTTNGLKHIYNSGYDYLPYFYYSGSDSNLFFELQSTDGGDIFKFNNISSSYTTASISALDPTYSTLTFSSYNSGQFTFTLDSVIYSVDVEITEADVHGYDLSGCQGGINESDDIPFGNNVVISAGTAVGSVIGTSPMTCGTLSYKKVNAIQVLGSTPSGNLVNGATFTIPGSTTIFTVAINTACSTYPC